MSVSHVHIPCIGSRLAVCVPDSTADPQQLVAGPRQHVRSSAVGRGGGKNFTFIQTQNKVSSPLVKNCFELKMYECAPEWDFGTFTLSSAVGWGCGEDWILHLSKHRIKGAPFWLRIVLNSKCTSMLQSEILVHSPWALLWAGAVVWIGFYFYPINQIECLVQNYCNLLYKIR